MKRVGVPRLICVTLLGIGESRANAALLYRHVVFRLLRPMVADKVNQEWVVRGSGLEWVIVRPPTIIGGRQGARVRVLREGERGRVGLVARPALARLLVDTAETHEGWCQAIVAGR